MSPEIEKIGAGASYEGVIIIVKYEGLIIFLGFQSAENEYGTSGTRRSIAGDAHRQLGLITSGVKSRISDVAFF